MGFGEMLSATFQNRKNASFLCLAVALARYAKKQAAPARWAEAPPAPVKRRTCGGCRALSQALSACARLPPIASTAPSAMSRPPIQIQLM